jgi:hypothetical protein
MSDNTSTKNLQAAVSLMADLLTGDIYASAAFGVASSLIQKAHSEGRDLTDAELASVVKDDDFARAKLEAAIARAA